MVDVALYSGRRISELVGLRWNKVGHDCLMVDERCCRCDWSARVAQRYAVDWEQLDASQVDISPYKDMSDEDLARQIRELETELGVPP